MKIEDAVGRGQLDRLASVKRSRNATEVEARLRAVEDACKGSANLMPPVLAAVKAYVTLGEICDVFRKVWGAYRETGTF